jgi:hypothetical protein
MNNNITGLVQVQVTNEFLQEQFKLCEAWNDPRQWDALAMLYCQRGYELNALCCFRRADARRMVLQPVAVETEE